MIYFVFPLVNSTQNLAFSYYESFGVPETFVVFRALAQTKGYGRRGTPWKSAKGNLLFSVLFSIPADWSYSSMLVKIGASSVVKVLKDCGVSAYLKYPNDVFVQNKKISGILGNIFHTNDSLWGGILGIGVNINATPEIQDATYKTTSLKELSGNTWDIEKIMKNILQTLRQQLVLDKAEQK
ncbi:biotin--[acetyl-CoA-carboxylase] ligase [Holospora undulata]|uniref:Bifunctional protein BirA n=1 Tax=Holospora undulata HU1 TaxID=1321371 RepID=A0A061JHF9_9PROT|nr:biotin--[acetyl-CoA-carboxylase] ligase [Holospora undulata]ETZ04797.1 bifunctional protein BirA [Holospora undulata HU1]